MSVRITMTSDYICPWCYIGEARLQEAVSDLPEEIDIDLHWLPYELNSDMQKEGMNRKVYRSLKFGSWARSQQLDAQTVAASRDDGVEFNYDKIERTPNTFEAHRLTWLAGSAGKQKEAAIAILEAYFRDGRDIGNVETLYSIGQEIGLNDQTLSLFKDSDEGRDAVRDQINQTSAEARGVPQFDIEGIQIGGAQPASVLRAAILEAYNKQKATATLAAE